jgi:hypothetical protein
MKIFKYKYLILLATYQVKILRLKKIISGKKFFIS